MTEEEATRARVLVADDQADVREALRLLLKGAGMDVIAAASPRALEGVLAEQDVDLILMDLNYARDTTSGREGLDLLARLRAADSATPIVVMTAWGSIEGAVEALQKGARDYVQKPWENTRLLTLLRTQIALSRALKRSQRREDESARQRRTSLPHIIADAPAMAPVMRLVEQVGPSDANVLVTGEHGTGKEVIARLLHAVSLRRDEAFVAVNAGGLSDGVFESELFGHVKGAFTDAKSDRAGCFELAHGGTLFLDEIGNMPMSQQQKLLRVLQTGEYQPVGSSKVRHSSVRVVSATNMVVHDEVASGRFRADLLYRLNTVEICLPPLRERVEDIPPLAAACLERQARRYGKPARALSPGALAALLEHSWPGNVRELEHVIERAVLLSRGDEVEPEDLGLRAQKHPGQRPEQPLEGMTLDEVERLVVTRALSRCRGNVTEAAQVLGLSRSALYRRLQQFGLKGSE